MCCIAPKFLGLKRLGSCYHRPVSVLHARAARHAYRIRLHARRPALSTPMLLRATQPCGTRQVVACERGPRLDCALDAALGQVHQLRQLDSERQVQAELLPRQTANGCRQRGVPLVCRLQIDRAARVARP